MSPSPPPRPGPGGKPGQGKPQPEHPAEKGPPPKSSQGPPQRASKYVEVRKGKSGTHEPVREEEEAPLGAVSLPRSITQEQEQADLKARLGREELIDIDKRNALVKVKDTASEPSGTRKRSNGLWLLLLVVVIAVAAIIADKMHFFDKLKGAPAQPQAPK